MREITGTFAELTDRAYYSATTTDDYLHIKLTDEEDVAEALGRLRVIYPNIMKLSYDNTRTRRDQIVGGAEDVKNKSPLELFAELYEIQNNQPMSDVQRIFAQELIESIQEGAV
jgi:exonuclease SbcD